MSAPIRLDDAFSSNDSSASAIMDELRALQKKMDMIEKHPKLLASHKRAAIHTLETHFNEKLSQLKAIDPDLANSIIRDSSSKHSGGMSPDQAALQAAVANIQASLMGANTAGQAPISHRIYVGSLSYDITESHIRTIFSEFGKIKSVDMSFEPSTGRSKGYCFVTFESAAAAEEAIAKRNNAEILGRPMRVSRPLGPGSTQPVLLPGADETSSAASSLASAALSQFVPGQAGIIQPPSQSNANNRIYVGSVPFEVTTENIREIFSSFGTILSCNLLPSLDASSGGHRGYGFIEFADEHAAASAIQHMNGMEIGGRKIKVNVASGGSSQPSNPVGTLPMSSIPSMSGSLSGTTGEAFPISTGENLQNILLAAVKDGANEREKEVAAHSKLVALRNAVVEEDLSDPELEGDILGEAQQYGNVSKVVFKTHPNLSDEPSVTAFLFCASNEDAKNVATKLTRRIFAGRLTQAILYDEKRYDEGVYTDFME